MYEATHSTKQLLEKRLILDISSIRERVDCHEIILCWIDKSNQLADVLAKPRVASNNVLDVLHSSCTTRFNQH